VGILFGLRHTSSAAQLLTRLQHAGLIRAETVKPGPLPGVRSVRLWSLSGRSSWIEKAARCRKTRFDLPMERRRDRGIRTDSLTFPG
jgi:hypothetical protein